MIVSATNFKNIIFSSAHGKELMKEENLIREFDIFSQKLRLNQFNGCGDIHTRNVQVYKKQILSLSKQLSPNIDCFYDMSHYDV